MTTNGHEDKTDYFPAAPGHLLLQLGLRSPRTLSWLKHPEAPPHVLGWGQCTGSARVLGICDDTRWQFWTLTLTHQHQAFPNWKHWRQAASSSQVKKGTASSLPVNRRTFGRRLIFFFLFWGTASNAEPEIYQINGFTSGRIWRRTQRVKHFEARLHVVKATRALSFHNGHPPNQVFRRSLALSSFCFKLFFKFF